MMLVRSYQVLGQRDKALATISRARATFATDKQKLSQLGQLLRGADGAQNATSAPQTRETQAPANGDASAEQQMAMIKGMVEGLAERLKKDGRDVDGWIRLMRSYVVLGNRDQASTAAQNAHIALSSDSEALRKLDAAEDELGIGGAIQSQASNSHQGSN